MPRTPSPLVTALRAIALFDPTGNYGEDLEILRKIARNAIEETTSPTLSPILQWLVDRPVFKGSLDEAIHKVMVETATDLNNNGIVTQIAFLLINGWTEEEIVRSAHDGSVGE